MANLKHITLTGIDDRTDIKELVRLQKQYPLAEFGVLLSWSRQGSERRYPSYQTIAKFCRADLNLSAHVCGLTAFEFARGRTEVLRNILDEIGRDSVSFQRIQLNLAGFPAEQFTQLPTAWGSVTEIILQRLSIDEYEQYRHRIGDHPSILLDASGGCGKESPLITLEGPYKVGYAGGFGPDNVQEKLSALLKDPKVSDFWIDMESGVRSFDWFDTEKAEEVLRKSYSILKEN